MNCPKCGVAIRFVGELNNPAEWMTPTEVARLGWAIDCSHCGAEVYAGRNLSDREMAMIPQIMAMVRKRNAGKSNPEWEAVRESWAEGKGRERRATPKKSKKPSYDNLRKSYKRETQLASADGFVHYGMLNNLKKRGYEVPRGFAGSSDQLAGALGIDHSELAQIWRVPEDELRQRGAFTLSD